jgi:hypothetical protein
VHLAWAGLELTTSVVICTDCIGSCKFNYHTITAMTAPNATWLLYNKLLSNTRNTIENYYWFYTKNKRVVFTELWTLVLIWLRNITGLVKMPYGNNVQTQTGLILIPV